MEPEYTFYPAKEPEIKSKTELNTFIIIIGIGSNLLLPHCESWL